MVLKTGATFTGELLKEDDKVIAVRTSGAEVEWDKREVREILRFKGDKSS